MSGKKEIKALIHEYKKKGWVITRTGNHYKWQTPTGNGCTHTSCTPSDRRALLNIKGDLRRLENEKC